MPGCKICKEEMTTTPLCPNCVKEEMAMWLMESNPKLVFGLNNESEDYIRNIGNTHCVKCNKRMEVCSYCFIKHIANWLGNFEDNGLLMSEYNTYFNSPLIDNYGIYKIRPI